ncbi:MAG: autotransporter assembly complex family protein [Hyphomonadaceae bacterium]
MLRRAALPAICLAALVPAASAWAENPVEIQGIEGDLRESLEDALPARERPDSLFQAERLADEAAARARAFLRAEGYYAATVTTGADETPRAWILISPGPRFVFAPAENVFEAEPPVEDASAAVIARQSMIRAEAPARAADILAAEQAGLLALREAGYPDAEIGARRVVVDHATERVAATFHYAAGLPAKLGAVRVAPDGILRGNLAQRMAPWRAGDDYSPEKLARLRRNAAATGAFASVTTQLAPETNTEGQRDVILTLEPLERRTIEIGAGFSTTEGFGADIEWSRRNVLRRAETLTLGATVSELQQSARAELALPNAAGLGRTTRYSITAEREDAGPYDRDALSVAWSIDAEPRQEFALSYGVSASAEFYGESAGVANAYILTGFGDVRRDTTDSLLDARNGHILQARAEPAISTGDATLAFARFMGDARFYETPDWAEDFTFAARAHAGYVAPLGGDDVDLPLDRLFYAGGGGSVRGYEYNSIFPGDPLLMVEPVGGRALLEVSAETRVRVTETWGGAVFIDGGAAFNEFSDIEMRWGVGVGLRYDLGFAPLRIDIAVPLDRRESDDSMALYVSIGQAF